MPGSQSILVIDDDREMQVMLNHILKLAGYDVTTADIGCSALVLLEEYRPDLVLLDVTVPELNCFTVLDLIRQNSSIPIIMLGAGREVNAVRNALALGADDYVRKPFHTLELLARIRTKLRRGQCGDGAPLGISR